MSSSIPKFITYQNQICLIIKEVSGISMLAKPYWHDQTFKPYKEYVILHDNEIKVVGTKANNSFVLIMFKSCDQTTYWYKYWINENYRWRYDYITCSLEPSEYLPYII